MIDIQIQFIFSIFCILISLIKLKLILQIQVDYIMTRTLLQNIAVVTICIILSSNCHSLFADNTYKSKINEVKKVEAATFNKTTLLWPLPTKLSMNQTGEQRVVDPCTINYKIEANPQDYVKQILNLYLIEVFHCTNIKPGNLTFNIVVKNANQMVAEQAAHEKYQITIRLTEKWQLIADCYVGFLRALETFSQLFEHKNGKYVINHTPILIDDSPQHVWRGLMIDTSRHFIPIQNIKHQIDALMYNKMSILHWHIVDEDSFPMVVEAVPQLAQNGKFSGTYSRSEIKSIINYAKIRGVRVIPQFDTPAHTQSWGRSQKYKQIIVNCSKLFNGQFDPTIDLTYQVVNQVMKQINTTFTDSYIHFGGDQIDESCYENKPSIKEWMKRNNITTYLQLSNYYRKKQKSMWRNISSFRKAIYWANQQIDMPVDNDDVIQWWGVSKNVDKLAGRKNQVILSNYDLTYLDLGFGGVYGTGYGHWLSWRDMYKFEPNVKNVNVIGGQACMWSEINNKDVQDQKVWPRTSVINERLWNSNINGTKQILNIAQRLISQNKRMKQRGIKASPVTVGLCEKNATICWGHG